MAQLPKDLRAIGLSSRGEAQASVRASSLRLDANGKLFDMQADPGQTTPVNDQQQELASTLTKAVEWQEKAIKAGDMPIKDMDAAKRWLDAMSSGEARRVLLASGERVGLLTNGVELRILIGDPARPDHAHRPVRVARSCDDESRISMREQP